MFVLLTSQWRKRAAAFVVAVYALCLVAPVTAFAFSDTNTQAHCLTLAEAPPAVNHAGHHYAGMDHVGMTHEIMDFGTPAPATDDHGVPGKCCGLFCVSAIAPAFDLVTEPAAHATAVSLPAVTSLLGRSSSRIDRPPRVLLSL